MYTGDRNDATYVTAPGGGEYRGGGGGRGATSKKRTASCILYEGKLPPGHQRRRAGVFGGAGDMRADEINRTLRATKLLGDWGGTAR